MVCKSEVYIFSSPFVRNWGFLENWKSTASGSTSDQNKISGLDI